MCTGKSRGQGCGVLSPGLSPAGDLTINNLLELHIDFHLCSLTPPKLRLHIREVRMASTFKKKIVVAGGNGFLGSRICKSAVARGWDVTSVRHVPFPRLYLTIYSSPDSLLLLFWVLISM
jgi:hypothetical protein